MSDIINFEEDGDMDIIPIFGSSNAVDFHDEESREEFNDLFDSITDEARNPQIIYSELSSLLSLAGYVNPTPTELFQMMKRYSRYTSVRKMNASRYIFILLTLLSMKMVEVKFMQSC